MADVSTDSVGQLGGEASDAHPHLMIRHRQPDRHRAD